MNNKKITRSLKLTVTIAIAIILFHIFTTAPQYKPQSSSDVAKSITHSGLKEASNYVPVAIGLFAGGDAKFTSLPEIKKQVNLVEQLGYGYSLFCWEYTSIPIRKVIFFLKQVIF